MIVLAVTKVVPDDTVCMIVLVATVVMTVAVGACALRVMVDVTILVDGESV